jgi:AcrR family transcriptional regulator
MVGRGSYRGTAETRARIVAAALAEFSAGGYEASTLRSIAAAAGLSHPGLLHHFPTKQALLEAVLTAQEAAGQEAFDGTPAPTTAAELADVVSAAVALDRRATALVQLRARLAVAGGDAEHPAHDFAVRRYQRLAGQLAGQIAALPEGEVGPGVQPQEAADILLATIEGLLVRGLTETDLDVPRLVRLAVLRVIGG